MSWLYMPEPGGGYSEHSGYLVTGRFVMLNGIPTVWMYCAPECVTDFLISLRSGMTLTLLTGVPGLDAWMWSLRASHASLSAAQARDLQKPTHATDGLPQSGSFAQYDPLSHGWK